MGSRHAGGERARVSIESAGDVPKAVRWGNLRTWSGEQSASVMTSQHAEEEEKERLAAEKTRETARDVCC